MKSLSRSRKTKITAEEFDAKFERGENILKYLDFEKATTVKRVNVDFPVWMVEALDKESKKLNISRQAVIKMWVYDHLNPQSAHLGHP